MFTVRIIDTDPSHDTRIVVDPDTLEVFLADDDCEFLGMWLGGVAFIIIVALRTSLLSCFIILCAN